MAKRTVNVALIGYQFMGKAHSNAWRQAPRFFDLEWEPHLKVLCGRNREALEVAARKYGFEEIETDWTAVVERPDVDLVDVSAPGHLHAPISIAAAKAGKIVWCEKPLANTSNEAEAMVATVREAGVFHALFHNYRFCPAIQLAKRMIQEGALGDLRHFRAVYLQDWMSDPSTPMVWRLKKQYAGSGAHGDLNSHLIDLARFLVGEITEVSGVMKTFVRERPIAEGSQETDTVDVDDATAFLALFENGAMGTFEATRFALGRKNHNRIEINGSKGSLVFNLERMNELEYYDGSDPSDRTGFRLIQVTEPVHPFVSAWWPPGHIIGYEHTFVNLVADGLQRMAEGRNPSPNFEDGLACQRVLDAVERSAERKSWVAVQ
ncbi:MAG: oxidoreductase [Fimbriimonadales bacterium]|nr:MAG: oxidoreductase [Fimbriimonadales bacterium]